MQSRNKDLHFGVFMIQKIYYLVYLRFFKVFISVRYVPQIIQHAVWITIMGLYYKAWRITEAHERIEEKSTKRIELKEELALKPID
jgi:hypothetical protein